MKTESEPCDRDRLRLLGLDLLSPADLAGLERHLEGCEECRHALDDMVNSDDCLNAARQSLDDEDPTGLYDIASGREESLGFLAPSDWPDSLGRLGTYEIKGVLGQGGMGMVLKAFDPALNRNVAIKVLSAALATSGAARRRFLREARAAAAVVHEHVVGVFAVVESAGLPFLVMEYVPGRSLQDRLDKSGPLALPEILRIGTQTASGLAAAHAQGLVHRDVKPANILLENGVERVRLTDFGLARAVADAALTHSGVVAGTPHYMAPEQANGETVDHRADLFSLGSTLYATCAGHAPFRAESPLAVLRRVCDDRPRPIREINPEVPSWLELIIARLMAKDPADRFQTATEVALLLERCLAHVQDPLSVCLADELFSVKAGLKGQSPWRRRVITALALCSVAAGALALLHPTPERQDIPTQPRAPAVASPHGRSPHRDPAQNGVDEIAQQVAEAWTLAGQIEAGLHERVNQAECDRVSTLAGELARQVEHLEGEIVSRSRGFGPGSPLVPRSENDRRR
jgi:serine/threonine-protein kinase